MKKFFSILAMMLCVILSASIFTGCAGVDFGDGTSNGDNTDISDDTSDDNGDNGTGDGGASQDPFAVYTDESGITYTLQSNDTYTVTSADPTSVNLTILGEVNSKPVKAIASEAFMNKNRVESITLPQSIETIGDSAFRKCSKLLSINLENIKSIGTYAFCECAVLNNITVSSLQSLGTRAFEKCAKLKSISMPATLTEIPLGCFSGCTILKTVNLGEGVKTIKGNAFNGCSLLTNIDLSKAWKLAKYTAYAFGIPIPVNQPAVGDNAFAHESGIHADGALKDRRNY